MRTDVFDLVLESINVEEDTIERKSFKDGKFVYLEAVSKFSFTDVTYLIYLCNGEFTFLYDEYMEVKKEIEDNASNAGMTSFYIPIFVFDDLDCETKQFEEAYEKIKKAEDRKNLKRLFDEKKISLYRNKTGVFRNR